MKTEMNRIQEILEEIAADASEFFFDRGLSQVVDTLSYLLTIIMAQAETNKRYKEAMDTAFVIKELTAFLVRISENVSTIEKLKR